ncbi:mandelate racemase/muconate lactonizing enzyme family protein [Rhodovulum sp. DZ06]|uniref:mandelate racemase/muconate lactonizing enzyme family protein n=1 Tax=Rhodovulum sp. DZ06 TaxID=3425126 RepID=UPI003D33DD66
MSGTRIEAVRTHLLQHKLGVAFESASMQFDTRTHLLVEVVCEDGTVGWGECLGPAGPNRAVVEAYANWLVGMDALETEKAWATLYNALRDQGQRGLTLTALSGIDVALWDIRGKRFGAPVSVLLGGRFRDKVRAYATGGFRRAGVERVSDMAAEAAQHRAAGFHAMKIKIGFDVEEDLEVIAAVRDAIGPEMRLMIDANHGYDVLEACALGRRAAEFGIDWFEEPVTPEHLSAYAKVRAGQPIPVAGGETWQGRHAHRQALDAGAVDILQPDLCGCGGYTEMRRIVDLAQMDGVRVVPHVWGTGVQIAASLHALSALPPSPVRKAWIDPILEFDRTEMPFRQAILSSPIEHSGGWVQVPDGPGLGIEIDRDALARFAPA